MEHEQVTLAAVGDIMVGREKPASIFEHAVHIIRASDIAFFQSETSYSDKGSKGSSGPRGAANKDLHNYSAIPAAGFDVVSMASNHTLDWGEDALLDCIARFRRDGIATIGAGANIKEAREPAIIECKGNRIAFLGYCSVAPKSYYAATRKSGMAPMRAITHYEPLEDDQPGTPAQIMTYPYMPDLDELVRDVNNARERADIVVVSLHWGIHFIRAAIADYQPVVAHAAIDAGADIILGHHPHMLKGIEVYKGKVILYSLGNFAFDSSRKEGSADPEWGARRKKLYRDLYQVPDPEAGSEYNFNPESRRSMIAKVTIAGKKIRRVSFVPLMINKQAQPMPVSPADADGKEVLSYLKEITEKANLNASYVIDGDEVVIAT